MNLINKISWKIRSIRRNYLERNIPSYEEKRSIILKYKKKYKTDILIETGTFLGDTVETLKSDFKKIVSFELAEDLAVRAAKRFENDAHVEIVQGDSGKLLSQYLSRFNEPCLLWLDGHYSSEFYIGDEYFVTAKGEKHTPILEELTAVSNHPIKTHVVLIDDARCFNGERDYPTIGFLKAFLKEKRMLFKISKKRDIIRIVPHN